MTSFKCLHKECTGLAVPTAKDGRFYTHPVHKWCWIGIPQTMEIHRCTVCAEDWLTKETQDTVTAYMAVSFEEHADMITKTVDAYRSRQNNGKRK